MSELIQMRDHARFMAAREHAVGCPPIRSRPARAHTSDTEKWCGESEPHEAHGWQQPSPYIPGNVWDWNCHGICGGCLPGSEQALWTQIADEIDNYLAGELTRHDQEIGLFE